MKYGGSAATIGSRTLISGWESDPYGPCSGRNRASDPSIY